MSVHPGFGRRGLLLARSEPSTLPGQAPPQRQFQDMPRCWHILGDPKIAAISPCHHRSLPPTPSCGPCAFSRRSRFVLLWRSILLLLRCIVPIQYKPRPTSTSIQFAVAFCWSRYHRILSVVPIFSRRMEKLPSVGGGSSFDTSPQCP